MNVARRLMAVLTALPVCAFASSATWNGAAGNGRWCDNGNWNAAYPVDVGDVATFGSDAVVTLDGAGTNDVAYVNVTAGTVTLGAGNGSVLRLNKDVGSGYANGFLVAPGAKLVLEAPVLAEKRIDKWYAGDLVVRSRIDGTVQADAPSSWGFILGRGENVVEGNGAICLPKSILGIGNGEAWSAPTRLLVRDAGEVTCGRLYLRVATSPMTTLEAMEQDGDATRVAVAHELCVGYQRSAPTSSVYTLRRGALAAGILELGRGSAGTFRQEGGTAVVDRVIFSTNATPGRLELAGGRFEFTSWVHGNGPSSIDFSGGEFVNKFTGLAGLPDFLHLSGRPVFAPIAQAAFRFAAGMTVEDDTEIVIAGAGAVEPVTGAHPAGRLTVDGGLFRIPTTTTVEPRIGSSEPWKVQVKNGGRIQLTTITSRLATPLDLDLSDGGKILFNHTGPYVRSVLVAHRLVLDGVEQPKGRYAGSPDGAYLVSLAGASIVIPYVWTGAGDGTTWTDAANWEGGVVPPNDGTAPVDLSRAAGKTITLAEATKITFLGFMPSGAARTLTIGGSGSLTFTGTSMLNAAFLVPPDAEVVMDVDVKRDPAFVDMMAFVGGGRLTIHKSYPSQGKKRNNDNSNLCGPPPFALDGTLAFEGPLARTDAWTTDTLNYRILTAHRHEVEGTCRVVVEKGCTLDTWRIFAAPGAYQVPTEIVQEGGTVVSESDMYLSCNGGTPVSTFGYWLKDGTFTTKNVMLGSYYWPQFARLPGGSFWMLGGTANVTKMASECNNNYFYLLGGTLNLGADGFVQTVDNEHSITRVPNAEPTVQLGGVTIHPTANVTCALSARFRGEYGDSLFDLDAGDFTFTQPVDGTGGFVKRGAKTLTFQGANTFTGAVTVESGLVYLPVGSSLTGVSRITVAEGATLQIYGDVSAAPTVLDVASEEALVLGANASFTVNRLFVGGVERTGSVTFGSGTVTVDPVDEGVVWTGATDDAWGTAANWEGGVVPNGATAKVDLSRAAGRTVRVNGDIALAGLVCRRGGTVTLTADGGAISFENGATVTVDAGVTLVLDVDVTLVGFLYKEGPGRLVVKRKAYSAIPPASLTSDTSFLVTHAGETELRGEAGGIRLWTDAPKGTLPRARTIICEEAVCTNFVTANTAWASSWRASEAETVQNGGVLDLCQHILPNFRSGFYFSMPVGGTAIYTLNDGVIRIPTTLDNYALYGQAAGTFQFIQNGGTAGLSNLMLCEVATQNVVYELNDGTLELTRGFRLGAQGVYDIRLNGGRVEVAGTTTVFPARQAVKLGGRVTFATAEGVTATLPCDLAGEGELVHEGPGTLKATTWLTGTRNIETTGGTLDLAQTVLATNVVVGGDLVLRTDGILLPETTLSVAAGGGVELRGAGETVVRTLTVRGAPCAAGVYGAPVGKTCSGMLSGTGTLRVLEGHGTGMIIIIR